MRAMDSRYEGCVAQIDPEHDETFGGCFMVITEAKSWGAQGYVNIPGKEGVAYYRCPTDALQMIGEAEWVLRSNFDADN